MSNEFSKKLKVELCFITFLCASAIVVEALSFSSALRPTSTTLPLWFQRSGAITSIFATFAQFRISNFFESIRGGTFNESWKFYHKFNNHYYWLSWIVALLAVWGAVVWGYGDLLLEFVWK